MLIYNFQVDDFCAGVLYAGTPSQAQPVSRAGQPL